MGRRRCVVLRGAEALGYDMACLRHYVEVDVGGAAARNAVPLQNNREEKFFSGR